MWLESWLYKLPLRLRSLFGRKGVEEELEQEMRFHLEQRVEANVASGMTPEAARYEALRAMGGLELKKEECRDARGLNLIENLGRDIKYAARMLRKSPVFTAVAVLSLALGIGANTAIFSLMDALLIRPLPVAHPGELRSVSIQVNQQRLQYAVTVPIFEELRAHSQIFSSVFTWANHQFQMHSGSEMVHIDGTMASGDYFDGLGVHPIAGRTFGRADDQTSGGKDGPVAVISEQFWMEHFQRAPSALGSRLTLDGLRYTVIGVMPGSFFGSEVAVKPSVWVPLNVAGKADDPVCFASRSCWWLVVMGRLQSGLSEAQAKARLKVVSPQMLHDTVPNGWPPAQQQKFLHWSFQLSPGEQGWTTLRNRFTHPLAVMMILVGLVLMIACANLANLLLARASARHREIGVRLSMGATRVRIIRQLLTESALLSLLGGAAGCFFAFWFTRLLVTFLQSNQPDGSAVHVDLQPDWRIVLFTLAVALASGLLFGLAPALRATRTGIAASLKESAQNIRSGDGRLGIGRFILPLQAALSVLLVAAAGLFAGSLFHLLTLQAGFNTENLSVIEVDTSKRPANNASLIELYSHMLEHLNGLPGVKAASLMWFTPLSGRGWDDSPDIPGRNDLSEQQRDAFINPVGPHFFDAMEISILAGRQFSDADTANSEKVGVINELAARRFFPGKNPVGEQIVLQKAMIRIVGIARNIRYASLREPEPLELYIPYTQKTDGISSLTFVIKTAQSAPSIYPAFRSALHEIAPDVPVGRAKTMEELVNDSVSSERLMASLSIFFGVLALVLTSIGLYGILAYMVTRRTGEIGIRMALGATGHNVIWLVLKEVMGYVAAGVTVGVIAVLSMSRLVAGFLYGIRPNDPGNLLAAVAALMLVAAAAGFMPAWRASRLDPTVSLRQE